MEKRTNHENNPTPLTPDEIRTRIAELDREIIALTSTSHLSEVPKKNELGSSLEEGGIEGELNFNDFSAEEGRVKHLRDEKAALQARLDSLSQAA